MIRKHFICGLAALFGLSAGDAIERLNSAAGAQNRIDQSRSIFQKAEFSHCGILVSAARSRSSMNWSLKSGRNRGEFIGCPTNLTGLALLDDGRRLVAGCGDGRIRVWDAAGGIKQVYEFERSLAER